MKKILLGAAALVLSAGMAHAEDLFAIAYGNTVTQTAPDGTKRITYVNADKTWEQKMPDGTVLKGTYAWKDASNVCFTLTDPAPKDPAQATNCNKIEGNHKLGDTWTEKGEDGQDYTMSITAGR